MEQIGYWLQVCDFCGEQLRYAWRYAWRPSDPEPQQWVATHWECAELLADMEPKTWVYKGAPAWRLYMPGFERGDTVDFGNEDILAHLRDEIDELIAEQVY